MYPWMGTLLPFVFPRKAICHCLLVEYDQGLILIDTGLGTEDLANPRRLGLMSYILGVETDINQAAVRQIEQLGYSAEDVRHIIPTHLDLDHASGIKDFPHAKVHTLKPEWEAAMSQNTFREQHRYRDHHWTSDTQWEVHELDGGEKWFGFNAVRDIPELPPDLLLIPLFGHTQGHFGVAVNTAEGWYLHAGDAFYSQKQLQENEKALPGWWLFERFAHVNYSLAQRNKQRLCKLQKNESVRIIAAHDADQFERE